MKLAIGGSAVLAVAAVAGVGYVAWRMSKAGGGVIDEAKQAIAQVGANVQSAWVNNVSNPWNRGQAYGNGEPDPLVVSSKAWLYSDYGYTGNDPMTGEPVVSGEWYGSADARRYDYEQKANGTPPAATSINGAAFGIYPRP